MCLHVVIKLARKFKKRADVDVTLVDCYPTHKNYLRLVIENKTKKLSKFKNIGFNNYGTGLREKGLYGMLDEIVKGDDIESIIGS